MRKILAWLLIGSLVGVSAVGSTAVPLADEDRILPSSVQLERKTQTWCPNDCVVMVPFVASYHRGAQRLTFVGARHAFNPKDPTMHAVAAGFERAHPGVVILEGFPTIMGENPPALVQEANRYEAPGAPDFDRSEAMYAASLALSRRIPFIGGEPTEDEQLEVLKAKGFTDRDIAFNSLLGWFSQAVRSRDIPDTSLQNLERVYPRLAGNVLAQVHLQAPTLAAFRQRYKELYGVDIVGDAQFALRTDVVNDKTRNGQQSRVDMATRDRYLLGLIEQELADHPSVLVIYGGSHWSTLSAALEKRLGKPAVRPFPN